MARTRRIKRGVIPAVVLAVIAIACLGSLPWLTAVGAGDGVPRYAAGLTGFGRMPPVWASDDPDDLDTRRRDRAVAAEIRRDIASAHNLTVEGLETTDDPAVRAALRERWPTYALGSDLLGRSLLQRLLVGGAISLVVGIGASVVAVVIGVMYGALAGYAGGRVDSLMMRAVDVLYGLPTVLLVVLLAVASDALVDNYVNRNGERQSWVLGEVMSAKKLGREDAGAALTADADLRRVLDLEAAAKFPPRELPVPRKTVDLALLFLSIGGVSWLTMSRVIRGQVMALKGRPFVEAARAMGASPTRIFFKHLLPNLVGPIVVYATLMVPQAILQESFLSFLGMGVKPPLPSWGTLCADGLSELNPYRSNWWLLVFPCGVLAVTLLALNFLGEAVRERLDPKGKSR